MSRGFVKDWLSSLSFVIVVIRRVLTREERVPARRWILSVTVYVFLRSKRSRPLYDSSFGLEEPSNVSSTKFFSQHEAPKTTRYLCETRNVTTADETFHVIFTAFVLQCRDAMWAKRGECHIVDRAINNLAITGSVLGRSAQAFCTCVSSRAFATCVTIGTAPCACYGTCALHDCVI